MAEAHQGVAFSFHVTEDEGLHINVSFEAFKAVFLSGLRSYRKFFIRLINQILNGVYPSHPLRGVALVALITALRRYKHIDLSFGMVKCIQDHIPKQWVAENNADIIASFGFATGVWFTTVLVRKYSLQALYSYHGWMYEARSSMTLKTKIWSMLLKAAVGNNPRLFSNQNSLPSLPVPSLKDTITRYLRTVRPLLDDDAYTAIEKKATSFLNGDGKRLQRYLTFKSFLASNYVTDWWEEYVYLRGRSPIMVNSNYYIVDSVFQATTTVQAARAATCIVAAFQYRKSLDQEYLKPMIAMDMIPLCSHQHERQFNTTRVPGEIGDSLVHYSDSKHVAVYSNGKWFKLYTYFNSKPLNAKELQHQIQKIIDDDSETTDCERHLGALTAGERQPWAHIRNKQFNKGVNKSSLYAIEKAAFCVILDEEEYKHSKNEDGELDRLGRAMLHGKGYDRWFDKSFTLIFTKNGRVGLNAEHSWADAPVNGHMWEHILAAELKMGYEADGNTHGSLRMDEEDLPDPTRLKWDFNKKIKEAVADSLKVATDLLNDVDLHINVHDSFGKGLVKKCRVSPDSFIQMALQLAYYRDIGRFHLTYEASMTRLFKEGRTETVRACTIESSEWVKSMMDPEATKANRLNLFHKACEYHVSQYRNAMTGKGVDRHIFCLYVVSKYLELDIPFLKEVLSEPWRLSTSQTPASQTNLIDFTKHPEYISAGGGFGPVSEDGYGVSYIVYENMIFFHVSSKKSSENTDSVRFCNGISKAMQDLKEMFDA
jgi:carnitine O-palmitoyltransferase 1